MIVHIYYLTMYFLPERLVQTFSICAVEPESRTVGAAVASRYIAVGALVPFLRSDAGVVLTQSVANPSHGDEGLELLSTGIAPRDALDRLLALDPKAGIRQVAILGLSGAGATYSGSECTEIVAEEQRPGLIAMGNTLASAAVPAAMVEAYLRRFAASEEAPAGAAAANRMAAALIGALEAGEAAGGDKRGKQAAAVLIAAPGAGYGGNGDIAVDLRVDDHEDPVKELSRIFGRFLQNQREEFAEDGA